MKANEFIKKFGWDVATKLSKEMRGITESVADGVAGWGQSEWDKLKRIVESHELVGSYKGLHCTKNTLGLLQSSMKIGLYHGIDGVDAATEIPRLEQAIADVESCQ